MTRIKKKYTDLDRDLVLFMEWLQDFRGALLEAHDENSNRNIIFRQFKRRMIRRGNRNRWFSRTRMTQYKSMALDSNTLIM